MDNKELQDNMLGQPQTILKYETDLIELSKGQANMVRAMNDIEAHIKADVAGNLNLKNPEQRKMATLEQTDNHRAYQELKAKIPDVDVELRQLGVQIRYERDILEVYLALARMRAGQ